MQISGGSYNNVMICKQELARPLSVTRGYCSPLSNLEGKFQA